MMPSPQHCDLLSGDSLSFVALLVTYNLALATLLMGIDLLLQEQGHYRQHGQANGPAVGSPDSMSSGRVNGHCTTGQGLCSEGGKAHRAMEMARLLYRITRGLLIERQKSASSPPVVTVASIYSKSTFKVYIATINNSSYVSKVLQDEEGALVDDQELYHAIAPPIGRGGPTTMGGSSPPLAPDFGGLSWSPALLDDAVMHACMSNVCYLMMLRSFAASAA
jgi:hypothetical protein